MSPLCQGARRPGDSGDHERLGRDLPPAPLSQLCAPVGVEACQVVTGWTDAARKRLPPGFEGRVLEAHGECGRFDLAQPGGLEQLGQLALARAREVGLVVDVRIEQALATALGSEGQPLSQLAAWCQLLISLGDCAVTGNVPSMRNTFGRTAVLDLVYIENATIQKQIPREVIPKLLKFSKPVHELVKVDFFLPGCPPSADTIFFALQELVAGRIPQFEPTPRFGA